MFPRFTSVNDLKRRLPDTLVRLETLKQNLYYMNKLINRVVEMCLEEDVSDVDYGIFTTEQFFNLCVDVRDKMEEEIEYLKEKISSLPKYKDKFI